MSYVKTFAPSMCDYKNLKTKIANQFNKAAITYDAAALMQQQARMITLDKLDFLNLSPETILDLGASTGASSHALAQTYPKASITGLDIANKMLSIASKRYPNLNFVHGDIELLPFADNTFDLIFSNLAIQWCDHLNQVFKSCQRVLKPGGLLLFSTLGPDTLWELKKSWASLDKTPHVNNFKDMHPIGDLMLATGLEEPVMDREFITLSYPNLVAMMRDLKETGASTVIERVNKPLTGKHTFLRLTQAYKTYKTKDNRLPATFEVIFGHAFKPTTSVQAQEIKIPVEAIGTL